MTVKTGVYAPVCSGLVHFGEIDRVFIQINFKSHRVISVQFIQSPQIWCTLLRIESNQKSILLKMILLLPSLGSSFRIRRNLQAWISPKTWPCAGNLSNNSPFHAFTTDENYRIPFVKYWKLSYSLVVNDWTLSSISLVTWRANWSSVKFMWKRSLISSMVETPCWKHGSWEPVEKNIFIRVKLYAKSFY